MADIKAPPQVVGLNTLSIRSEVFAARRPVKKRVFTDDEWKFLNGRTNEDLLSRIERGRQLIALLHNPAMLNMTQGKAAATASNLHYQIDAIWSILNARGLKRP